MKVVTNSFRVHDGVLVVVIAVLAPEPAVGGRRVGDGTACDVLTEMKQVLVNCLLCVRSMTGKLMSFMYT